MKPIIFVLSFCLSLFNCQIETHKDSGLAVKTVLKGDYNLPQFAGSHVNDSTYYFLVEVNLVNKNHSEIKFLTYSCSPIECFVLNTDSVQICFNNCNKNSLTLINLKPKGVYSLPIILQANSKNPTCHVKVGFILLDPDIKESYLDVLSKRRKSLKDVIWSESIFLHPGGGLIYEIK